ncbi:MAG: hypothetical protein GEV06_25485 [Luteitalea sp.]|nr:hypothetical protein [Luteitalea sp.]
MTTHNPRERLPLTLSITIALCLLATFATRAAAQSSDFYDQWLLIHGAPHVLDDVRREPLKQQRQALEGFFDQWRWQQQRSDLNRRLEHWQILSDLQRQETNRQWDALVQGLSAQQRAHAYAAPATAHIPEPPTPTFEEQLAREQARRALAEQLRAEGRLGGQEASEDEGKKQGRACPFWVRSCWK